MRLRNSILAVGAMLVTNSTFAEITYPDQGLLAPIPSALFERLDIRLGTVSSVEVNSKARVPGFVLKMNFGSGFDDLKQCSAQLRDNYYEGEQYRSETTGDQRQRARLYGMQVAAVTNFPARSVGIRSYFLTLGVVSLEGERSGTVVLRTVIPAPDGAKVKLLNDNRSSYAQTRGPQVEYADTFHHLDIRIGTITSLTEKTVDFGQRVGVFKYRGDYPLFAEGMQILRIINLEDLRNSDNFLGVVDQEGRLIPLTLERRLPNGRFLK